MHSRLSGGNPDRTVLVYVGRLGFEKNLNFLRGIMDRVPNVALAFVGDGPAKSELQRLFRGTATTFMGMLHVRRGEDWMSCSSQRLETSTLLFYLTVMCWTELLGYIRRKQVSALPVLPAGPIRTEQTSWEKEWKIGIMFSGLSLLFRSQQVHNFQSNSLMPYLVECFQASVMNCRFFVMVFLPFCSQHCFSS